MQYLQQELRQLWEWLGLCSKDDRAGCDGLADRRASEDEEELTEQNLRAHLARVGYGACCFARLFANSLSLNEYRCPNGVVFGELVLLPLIITGCFPN